jgi:anti-sigma regulatory factor (Ser/Thr protein kinase)
MSPADPEQKEWTAVFVARYESLDAIREFVGQAAEVCCMDKKSVYAVQMATDEACTNIIEHAYGGESDNSIECTCRATADQITIILYDCGHTFDPNAVPSPTLNSSLEERSGGGLGLFFMHQLMDEIHFEFIPATPDQPACNILTMVKRKEQHS